MLARGRVWALLALLRLHLVQPPAGADPAGKYDLVRQHVLDLLRFQLRPELAVRRQCTALPGSPDEAARIARLEARCDELDSRAERLQRRSTPRPAPPQYLEVRSGTVLKAGVLARATQQHACFAAHSSATTWRASSPALARSHVCWKPWSSSGKRPAADRLPRIAPGHTVPQLARTTDAGRIPVQ